MTADFLLSAFDDYCYLSLPTLDMSHHDNGSAKENQELLPPSSDYPATSQVARKGEHMQDGQATGRAMRSRHHLLSKQPD